MRTPEVHGAYLKQRNTNLRCSPDVFSAREISLSKQYGCWMEALTTGRVSAITDEQKQLVEVHNNKTEPASSYARLVEAGSAKEMGRRILRIATLRSGGDV